MKKLLMILTVTAFAVVANAGEACCATKKVAASGEKGACTSQATACTAKATSCSEKTSACGKAGAQKVTSKQLKSPRHASQS